MQWIKRSAILSFFVFAGSVFLIFIYSLFYPDLFIYDDNQLQWLPVIERAYDEFFATGEMPVYDFFQFKGMPIVDSGYYGILNPLMLLSYVVGHFVFSGIPTLNVYITILFGLGNVCFFLLSRQFKNSIRMSLLFTIAYSGISAFFSFQHWYYVFDNYLFVPLLILVFVLSHDRKIGYISCGLLLAFEMLMGNMQYTCYHFMLFGLLCVAYFFVCKKDKKYVLICVSNVAVAALLSIPVILTSLQASSGFSSSHDSGNFLSSGMPITEFLAYGCIPTYFMDEWSDGPFRFFVSSAMGRRDGGWFYNGGFVSVWLVMIGFGIICLFRKISASRKLRKIQKSNGDNTVKKQLTFNDVHNSFISYFGELHPIMYASIIVLIFFYLFMSGNIVAIILSKVPVVNNFRYLFKCMFIMQPMIGISVAILWPRIQNKLLKRIALVCCCVFSVFGLFNNFFVIDGAVDFLRHPDDLSYSECREEASSFLDDNMLDRDKYRTYGYNLSARFPGTEILYGHTAYLKNTATTESVYALLGYELSIPADRMLEYKDIVGPEGIEPYSNMVGAGCIINVLEDIDKGESSIEDIEQQFISNAVKYVFLLKRDKPVPAYEHYWESLDFENPWCRDDAELVKVIDGFVEDMEADNLSIFCNLVDLMDRISVSDIKEFDTYYLIELSGVNGLCINDKGEALSVLPEYMNKVSFYADGSTDYTLAFSYNDGLEAYIEDDQGSKVALSLSKSEDCNNTIVHANGNVLGRITVTYFKNIYVLCFVFEWVSTVAVVLLLVFMIFSKKRSI